MFRILPLALVALFSGCVASPTQPVQGRGTLWGYVRLTPPEGVNPAKNSGAAYADLRLRDVTLVDYERPDFAVVYLDQVREPSGTARLMIRPSRFGLRLDPEMAAVGLFGSIEVVNSSEESALVSCPSANLLQELEPGSKIVIPAARPGLQEIFVLDSSGTQASVFVSSGPYTVISEQGRFELSDIPPGTSTLRVWHPRFPPLARQVEISPDVIQRMDLEMRIDT